MARRIKRQGFAIDVLLRKDNPGLNKTEADRTVKTRSETEWPLARTQYTRWQLRSDLSLSVGAGQDKTEELSCEALTGERLSFTTAPFEEEIGITGHITANLSTGVRGEQLYLSLMSPADARAVADGDQIKRHQTI